MERQYTKKKIKEYNKHTIQNIIDTKHMQINKKYRIYKETDNA